MFGGMKGVSASEYSARMNALSAGSGGGRGGRSVPSQQSHMKGATTTPLCLCELMRKSDQARKK